jgi:HlyD family secretion protein
VIAKNDFERAQDALKSAEIRRRHTPKPPRWKQRRRPADPHPPRTAATPAKLQLQEAQRRVAELTLRAPMDGLVGSLSVADRAWWRPTHRC